MDGTIMQLELNNLTPAQMMSTGMFLQHSELEQSSDGGSNSAPSNTTNIEKIPSVRVSYRIFF